MSDIERKIRERKKVAVKKEFFSKACDILGREGKFQKNVRVFDNGEIEIKGVEFTQQYSETEMTITIKADGRKVFEACNLLISGEQEDGVSCYVPGAWEEAFNRAAAKTPQVRRQRELRDNWGL